MSFREPQTPGLQLNGNFTSSEASNLVIIADDLVYANNYLGAGNGDIGAAVNAAYAALPSTGGTIRIKKGSYNFSTPIVFNVNLKSALLTGDGAGAVVLNFTGGSNTVAVTINTNGGVHPGYGISGLKLNGSSATGSQVGVFLGGIGADDFKGASGCTLRDVYIQNFGVGVETGNHCFLITIDTCVINFCGTLIYENGAAGAGASIGTGGANTIDAGETMRVINCTLADAHNTIGGQSQARYAVNLQNSGSTDWSFINTSFDDCELYINKTGGQSNTVHITNCHFENPGNTDVGGNYTQYTFITMLSAQYNVTLNLVNVQFVQDATTQTPAQFINSGGVVHLTNVIAEANAGSSTASYMVNFQDSSTSETLAWTGFVNINSAVTNMTSTFVGVSDSGWLDSSTTLDSINTYTNGTMIVGKALNVKGDLLAKQFNTIYDASQFSGADIGAQINAAYATAVAAGMKGCRITLPAGSFSFSTPVAISTDGTRAEIQGQGGDATILTFTGGASTTAFTFNCGYQGDGASSEHVHYRGLADFTLKGNTTSTTNPEVGVFLGGSNGAAGITLDNIKIEGFGQGLVTGSNTYFYSVQNCVIRNCGQNVYIGGTDNSVTNSGEGISFINCFIVDTASNAPTNGFMIDNSGATSVTITGGSFDDCQVRIQQANGVSFIGTHFENPGAAAWGSYVYVQIDQNLATNVNMNGCIFWQDGTGSNIPANFISNGGSLTMNSCWARTLTGQTVTNFVAITGSGRLVWNNLNRVATATFTNVVSGIPYISSGWTDSTGAFATVSQAGVVIARGGYTAQTSTYAILTTDELIDCTSGTFTVTLPTAVSVSGKKYIIKNSGTGVITIATTSSQTIDGGASSSIALSVQYSSITVVSDGANWKVTG